MFAGLFLFRAWGCQPPESAATGLSCSERLACCRNTASHSEMPVTRISRARWKPWVYKFGGPVLIQH
jgi:hypothetical protein